MNTRWTYSTRGAMTTTCSIPARSCLEYLAAERKIILKWALENSWLRGLLAGFSDQCGEFTCSVRSRNFLDSSWTTPPQLDISQSRLGCLALWAGSHGCTVAFVFCFKRSPKSGPTFPFTLHLCFRNSVISGQCGYILAQSEGRNYKPTWCKNTSRRTPVNFDFM